MSRQVMRLSLILAAAFAAALRPQPLSALSVELRNVSNDGLFSKIDFGTIYKNETHYVAQQYLMIQYPEVMRQEIRVFSNRLNVAPSTNTLFPISFFPPAEQNILPLYWTERSTPLAGGPMFSPFNENTEWRRMVDINDRDFVQRKILGRITLQPSNTSYIYLATKLSSSVPSGAYDTSLVIEVISFVNDVRAPTILPPSCLNVPLTQVARFTALIEDDSEVKSATFYYRLKGTENFTPVEMNLTQNTENPFQWNAYSLVNRENLQLGTYEYYFESNDGNTRSFFGSPAGPRELQLVDEFKEVESQVSAEGDKLVNSDCALQSGAPDLTFPFGSLPVSLMITVQKVSAATLPQYNGQTALSAYEFGPSGTQFDRPVPLTFPYIDDNQDGIVDGTGLSEGDLKIFWFDGFTWRNMGGKVNAQANTVTTNISHFSIYGVFAAGPLTADQVRPAERIITPNGDRINDFAQFGITGDFEIKILDIQGRRVRKLEGVNTWDGRTDSGEIAESGVYVYQVTTGQLGEKVTGTIAVAK